MLSEIVHRFVITIKNTLKMFKQLFFFVILGLFLLLILSVYKVFKSKPTGLKSKSKTVTNTDDINSLIQNLKDKITKAEKEAVNGIVTSQTKLNEYKEELEKALLYKEKIEKF